MKICFVVNECDFFYSHRLLLAQKLTADADVTLLTDTSRTSSKIIHNIHERKQGADRTKRIYTYTTQQQLKKRPYFSRF